MIEVIDVIEEETRSVEEQTNEIGLELLKIKRTGPLCPVNGGMLMDYTFTLFLRFFGTSLMCTMDYKLGGKQAFRVRNLTEDLAFDANVHVEFTDKGEMFKYVKNNMYKYKRI